MKRPPRFVLPRPTAPPAALLAIVAALLWAPAAQAAVTVKLDGSPSLSGDLSREVEDLQREADRALSDSAADRDLGEEASDSGPSYDQLYGEIERIERQLDNLARSYGIDPGEVSPTAGDASRRLKRAAGRRAGKSRARTHRSSRRGKKAGRR